jgi:TPR repeat protein
MRKSVATAFLVVTFSVFSHAAERDPGLEAYRVNDYQSALMVWIPLAEAGDVVAQFNIGYMYEFGEGVTPNHELAAKWYKLAADQGDANAQHSLGNYYFNSGSYAAATNWYKQSAEQGLAEAQADLGASFSLGQGVPQSYIYAHMWSNISSFTGFDKGARLTTELEELMSPVEISIAHYLAQDCIGKKFKECHTLPIHPSVFAIAQNF